MEKFSCYVALFAIVLKMEVKSKIIIAIKSQSLGKTRFNSSDELQKEMTQHQNSKVYKKWFFSVSKFEKICRERRVKKEAENF